MKKLFMVSNSHIDPVWLWEWQEGATAAVATFRAAADFCEEFDSYVFCHNEALLYQWTEEYDPILFRRIQELVRAGRWHIMGGWFLQPDCNLPSGESILRQVLSGRKYFAEKFEKKPTVAVNFDTFGHSRGLVQILSQCGYKGYLFMRPEKHRLSLPSGNFTWKGYDGSTVIGHRLSGSYANYAGGAVDWAEDVISNNIEQTAELYAWGVGNHGGGPARIDIQALNRWMKERTDIEITHSTPEAFFDYLEEAGIECPEFAEDLRPVFIGCYASQARLKSLHRKLENELYSAEKMAAAASSLGLMKYPAEELEQVQWDMMLNEFHDTLPGTTIESAAKAAERSVCHGLEIAGRVKMRAFMSLLSGQPKAKPEWVPIFVYNPHPHSVSGVFQCEFMPAQHQNWEDGVQYRVNVYRDGVEIPSQQEKPEYNMNLDWRQKVAFHATLEPFSMNRFDCEVTYVPLQPLYHVFPKGEIRFENDRMSVTINCRTGLVDSYCVDGVSYLKAGSLSTKLYKDNPDPWNMREMRYSEVLGQFALAEEKPGHRHAITLDTPEVAIPAVRILEDGPVRMIVEAEFHYGNSHLIQTYYLPRKGTVFEVEQRICWNEADIIAKLEIPCAHSGAYLGQGMFGCGKLPQDGTEVVSQKWCGIFGDEHALTVTNTATYSSHATEDTMYLSLLRAPAYAAHPVGDRPLIREDRFVPRVDQGEHVFQFMICGGHAGKRRDLVEQEALAFNESPYVINAFPGGEGEKHGAFLSVSDRRVVLSAMNRAGGDLMIRLFNSGAEPCRTTVKMEDLGVCEEIQLSAFRFQTYLVRDGKLIPVEPV